ncbi:hypothetical protein MHYP_G00356860 [Metynnis hypsauchen]
MLHLETEEEANVKGSPQTYLIQLVKGHQGWDWEPLNERLLHKMTSPTERERGELPVYADRQSRLHGTTRQFNYRNKHTFVCQTRVKANRGRDSLVTPLQVQNKIIHPIPEFAKTSRSGDWFPLWKNLQLTWRPHLL